MLSHNPTFRAPTTFPPHKCRSPTPPIAFIEPLSPPKPQPLEPAWSYPCVTNVDFPAHQGESATPRATEQVASHKSGHHRTSSTIDTLAEAALAASPSYHLPLVTSVNTLSRQSFHHAHPSNAADEIGEPPHKRARSELLPSPQSGPFASRPATSYEPPNGWMSNGQHRLNTYDSRVEEAALLLNFRTGGGPSHGAAVPDIASSAALRPHANSFPQDAYHARPTEKAVQALLPPFNPQNDLQPRPILPSPEQTIRRSESSFDHTHIAQPPALVLNVPAPTGDHTAKVHDAVQTQTPSESTVSRAESTENRSGEASEPPKGRRGWPKGKPRLPGGRKTIAEKVATKRAALRKKTPDTSKSTKSIAEEVVVSEWVKSHDSTTRRRSMGDAVTPSESDVLHLIARSRSVPRGIAMTIHETSPSKSDHRKAKVTSDTICAGCLTSRETTTFNSELDEWISCNGCKKWFHIDCAGFKKAHELRDVDKYFCVGCEPQHGKTTYVRKSTRAHASVDYAELQRGVLKTSEESVEHHYIQPIKDGTFPFDPESFPRMRPEMITKDFFEKSGTFVEPICIPADWNPRPWAKRVQNSKHDPGDAIGTDHDADGDMANMLLQDFEYDSVQDDGQDELDMVMPEGLTVRHVCNLVGPDIPLDVIDVKTQNSGSKWTMGRWADYYEEVGTEKAIRNVISLEVSQTKLGRLLRRPKIVRDLDLQDAVWPQEETDKGKYPKVQFYCLMSVADSYTDFHIDFGGSSVYYHILKGKKTFFFIPPKAKHLKAYEEWNDSPQQNFTFLPSITKECYRVDLSEGDTMLIPSGWIHAVWTPETSLVIGGNFLTRLSFKNQFKVVEIEKANGTPMKFRYPFFQRIMWYTAIQYVQTDPLPQVVSELFYEGKRFERRMPIWQDFDGDTEQEGTPPGSQNARYYSQAEVDGLPDLVNFIFRTVMVVKGHIEGTSQDQMKRVNASIPKGHGEPLEVAKTFALWVAWKRGNEDPPAWAHPDAVLPNSKEEGPSKKLSARALKEMERKEAIAAWRIAPDRQSARVMTKNAVVAADGTPNGATPSPAPPQNPAMPAHHHQHHQFASSPTPPEALAVAPPPALMMSSIPGHYFSTPKTSVLGPKRVACDACRKRRIRCKHKDMVMQTSPRSSSRPPGMFADAAFGSQLAPEPHDNITLTPPKQRPNYLGTVMDGQQDGSQSDFDGSTPTGVSGVNGRPHTNGHTPLPGTNAYVSANIPMTMNGVSIFGDMPKRGRSKACLECRKSKRRCVHDETGHVDPVKAAETPVPRGSLASRKRQVLEGGSPTQVMTQPKQATPDLPPPARMQPTAGILIPSNTLHGSTYLHGKVQPRKQSRPPSQRQQQPAELEQPPIDPSLFDSMYPEPESQTQYGINNYPYPTTEQASSYGFQSLEQIASQVLDMNGGQHEAFLEPALNGSAPQEHAHICEAHDTAPMPDGLAKLEDSVDSAVSLPTTEVLAQAAHASGRALTNGHGEKLVLEPSAEDAEFYHSLSPVQKFVEASRHETAGPSPPPSVAKTDISSLPLYKPPAPLSQSPETVKRSALPTMNGIDGHAAGRGDLKRKRDSVSTTPGPQHGASKKVKVDGQEHVNREASVQETEDERLARLLQQEDLGLRQRSR